MARNFEYIIRQLGGVSKFQVLIIGATIGQKVFIGWSMMLMAVAGIVPDFYCITSSDDVIHNSTQSFTYPSDSLNECAVNGSSCGEYRFQTSIRSAINEWDLVCDLSWIKATTTSVQMAGVLIGAILSGQLGDLYGRKKTTYGFDVAHLVFNVVIVFSNSWQMFMAFRFLIGIGIGALLVVTATYPLEFLPENQRALLSVLPTWQFGVCLFALFAYLLENWIYLHLACAAFSAPMLLGWFFVPESMRWLAVHGRTDDAYKTLEKMASVNGRDLPEDTAKIIQAVADEEKKARESGGRYSYVDIFRGPGMAKNTLSFAFMWCSCSMVFYGLGFGVSGLGGNPYLALFLLNIIDPPAMASTFFFSNRFGRRKTCAAFFFIGAVSGFGVLATELTGQGSSKTIIITVLTLIAKCSSAAAWCASMPWVMELYPTVTRNLGYGFMNTAARVGGIIAPFAIDLDERIVVSYVLIGSFLLASCVLAIISPETKGVALSDSIAMRVQPPAATTKDTDKGSNQVNVEVPEVAKVNKKEDGCIHKEVSNGKI